MTGPKGKQLFADGDNYAGRSTLDFGIKPGDRVVDVGGAVHTFSKATHVIDRLDADAQRYGRKLKVGKRKLLEGDVSDVLADLPDNHFDFCYSSHTFEHIDDLPKALTLISAKCRRGFYAVPASDIEFLTTKKHFGHLWLCRLLAGVLHIARRPSYTISDELCVATEEIVGKCPTFHNLFQGRKCRGYRFIWEARHYWEGHIPFEFHENPADIYPQVAFFQEIT